MPKVKATLEELSVVVTISSKSSRSPEKWFCLQRCNQVKQGIIKNLHCRKVASLFLQVKLAF